MNSKFLFVLFITIFYNGVTYASPATKNISDVTHVEVNAPTVTQVVVDKKIDSTPTPVPVEIANKTSTPLNHHSETTTVVENPVKIHPDPANKTTQGKNSTETATVVKADKDDKNNSRPIDDKNVNVTKNETAHVDVHPANDSTSTVSPTDGRYKNATTVAPASIPTTTTTTAKTTAGIKTNATTASPATTTSDKNLVEHTSPAPVSENHFHGASFVGGIVLTLGLTAIGFIAFKYYKSGKIDMSYRTL